MNTQVLLEEFVYQIGYQEGQEDGLKGINKAAQKVMISGAPAAFYEAYCKGFNESLLIKAKISKALDACLEANDFEASNEARTQLVA